MPLPPEFRVTQADGTLRIAWDNRTIPKKGCGAAILLAFWIIWTPFTVYHTVLLVLTVVNYRPNTNDFDAVSFLSVWLIFGWAITLFIPYHLLGRRWRESVEVTRETITHTRTGWFAPRPRVLPVPQFEVLALGWLQAGPEPDDDEDISFHLVGPGGRKARLTLNWVHGYHRYLIFETIRAFLAANDIPLKTVVWGKPSPKGEPGPWD